MIAQLFCVGIKEVQSCYDDLTFMRQIFRVSNRKMHLPFLLLTFRSILQVFVLIKILTYHIICYIKTNVSERL